MCSDREECGVHTAPQSTFHQQPHYGGASALPFELKCSVCALVSTIRGFRSSASWMDCLGTLRGPSHQWTCGGSLCTVLHSLVPSLDLLIT